MNILTISPAIYPCITGGVEIFNYYLTNELAKRGHKVWILTSCGYDWNNRNISLVKLNQRFLINRTLSTYFHLSLELIKLKKQIDVIYVPYTSNSPLAYLLLLVKKLFNIHYAVTIHGGGMYPWKPKILHELFFKNADAIVAVSETIRKEYEKRSGRKIRVIPPLIPFKESKLSKEELRKKYGFGNDDKVILSLGSIKKIKGSDTLLYAFLELGKIYIEKNNLRLLYVGDGPMKPMLAEKVKERNLDGYVKFLGTIPHEEAPHIYKLADIYVISSLLEGTPIALLEAMFNGLPIVSTDVVGINNLISHGKNGLLFEKKNIKDLTEKIKEVVENNDLSNQLGKAAKKDYLKNYKFEYVVSQYLKLFTKLCKEEND
ncbi:MAG TPA: glycosyltransferase family 4 protein [Thermoplasmata archaeon]|nr:glycosyltransferase family 4 protein [Thermoplasmata archaeon]